MRFLALATDYDNTLAEGGSVPDDVWEALRRLRDSGRRLVLVTGRELDDLLRICARLDLFDRVVVENGGVVYRPATAERRLLARHDVAWSVTILALSVAVCVAIAWPLVRLTARGASGPSRQVGDAKHHAQGQ